MFSKKLKDYLDSNGIKYNNGKQSYITACVSPSCGKDDHMYIRKSNGQSICFKCGSRWNWRKLVAAISRCNYSEAYQVFFGKGAGEELGEDLHLDLNLEQETEKAPQPIYLGPDFVPFQKSPAALKYLESRGVTNLELLSKYDVRYHLVMDAIVFPVFGKYEVREPYSGSHNKDGLMYIGDSVGLFGWQARKINPEEGSPRLLTKKSFDKSKFLLNYTNTMDCKKLILVEGPFDCLHVDLEGYGAVASLGKSVSLDQIRLLLDHPANEIYLGLDDDAASEVYEIVDKLSLKKRVFRIKPPEPYDDFGETPMVEVYESIDRAINTTALFLEVYLKEI